MSKISYGKTPYIKIPCQVIRDLLPLYVDDAVSDESRKMIDEHLLSCEGCRKELERLRSGILIPISRGEEKENAGLFRRFRRKFRKRKISSISFEQVAVDTNMRIIELRNSPINSDNHTIGSRCKFATGRQITDTNSLNIR